MNYACNGFFCPRGLPPLGLVRWVARLGFLACVLAIAWLAFTPQPDVPGLGWDKLNHVVAFAVLAMLADLGWPGRAAMPVRLAAVLGYGVVIELVQAQLTYRSASALDLAADAIGVAMYLALERAGRRLWAGWRERQLSRARVGVGRSAPAGSRRSPGE